MYNVISVNNYSPCSQPEDDGNVDNVYDSNICDGEEFGDEFTDNVAGVYDCSDSVFDGDGSADELYDCGCFIRFMCVDVSSIF